MMVLLAPGPCGLGGPGVKSQGITRAQQQDSKPRNDHLLEREARSVVASDLVISYRHSNWFRQEQEFDGSCDLIVQSLLQVFQRCLQESALAPSSAFFCIRFIVGQALLQLKPPDISLYYAYLSVSAKEAISTQYFS